jgi:DNA-binding NarL/FixJ family response regulator
VLIVDDHPIVRQGLKRMIETEPDMEVCGEAATEAQARRAIRELVPDIVIVDLALQEGDGLELVRDVHAHHPDVPMLVLSMHDETIYAERLLAEGASGYIMKQAAADQLLNALRAVLRGERYVSEQLAQTLGVRDGDGDTTDPVRRLSNRELQVLNLVGRGVSSRDIAAELGLSVKTVESHRQSIKRKLNLATNSQLLQYAMNWFNWRRGGRSRPQPEQPDARLNLRPPAASKLQYGTTRMAAGEMADGGTRRLGPDHRAGGATLVQGASGRPGRTRDRATSAPSSSSTESSAAACTQSACG